MRILYAASGISLPGDYGGSTHTLEVAGGLSARGRVVQVVVIRRAGWSGVRTCFRIGKDTIEDKDIAVAYMDIPKALSFLDVPQVGGWCASSGRTCSWSATILGPACIGRGGWGSLLSWRSTP